MSELADTVAALHRIAERAGDDEVRTVARQVASELIELRRRDDVIGRHVTGSLRRVLAGLFIDPDHPEHGVRRKDLRSIP